jgi:hypothetical protein
MEGQPFTSDIGEADPRALLFGRRGDCAGARHKLLTKDEARRIAASFSAASRR